jgi:hypothetical protein
MTEEGRRERGKGSKGGGVEVGPRAKRRVLVLALRAKDCGRRGEQSVEAPQHLARFFTDLFDGLPLIACHDPEV